MAKSLTDKTISGLNWNMLNNYSSSIIATIVGIILARLLTPTEFGLVGMVYIFTGLADLFVTLGMGKAVVRLKELTADHIKVATTLTTISSLIVYAAFFFVSPLIASFYNEPRLIDIIRVLSILFIIRGINTVSYGQLQKDLDFRTVMQISIGSNIAYGIISSTLAAIGLGVWSLVWGRISSASVASYLTLRKYPLSLKPLLKKKELKDLAGFGSGVSLSSILLYGSSNIDYFLVGKFINAQALGLYTKSFNLMTQSISRVAGGIYNVLFPAFAAAQNDTEKLRRAYFRTIKTVSYFVFPILGVMIIDADYVIKGLYGEKWAGAIPVFRILAFGGILRTTLSYSGAMAQATGRVYKEVFQQLVYFVILGGAAFYLLKFGIEGVAFAVVIALCWMFIAQSWLALKIIESDWKELFNSMIPGLANLFGMVLTNFAFIYLIEKFIYDMTNEVKLGLIVILNIFVFVSLIVFLPYSLKGDTFEWLAEKYKRFIPSFFIKLYFYFNNKSRTDYNKNITN